MDNVNSVICTAGNYCEMLVNRGKPLVERCSSSLKRIFYEQSIFFAANNQAIEDKFNQYKDLSWTQKFKYGVIKGAESLLVATVVVMIFKCALMGMSSGSVATTDPITPFEACACALIEEILHRGVMQNCLAGTQKIATYITPQCLQDNRVFKWITSPSARILSINTLFAAGHLSNGGTYISDKQSLIQASFIFLLPVEGILHETTGNIIAPIACHMTHNLLLSYL